MKRIIFAVLLSILMLTSGCSGNIQSGGSSSENNKSTADASSTEKKTEKATKKASSKSDKAEATEASTEYISEYEETTEKPTEEATKLPLTKNNYTSYIHMGNTGIIGKKLYYSNDHEWEYCKNDITAVLPEDILEGTGQFFVVGDYIYYTSKVADDGNFAVELRRMKFDGSEDEFLTDDVSHGFNCVYLDGYILYNCYSDNDDYFGLMSLNLETEEKINYASINNIQYAYKGRAYYLDGNYIKYFDPKAEQTGIVRNTGGSFICGDNEYIYYTSPGNGTGLFRINLNDYSLNEFVKSGVSSNCLVVNNVVYYYPYNTRNTSKISVYDISKGSELSAIDIKLTRKVYRFWSENGYLLFNVQNGSDELNMSDYIINLSNKKTYRISNYFASVNVKQ